jgi:YebC/PmpR family DNA-binding regulatory protein
MSGHSKWSTIRRKKEKVDAKRGKIFTKLIKEITVAARESGGDVDTNPRLRLAVMNAKAANMPNDNIERAIKKGTGELPGVHYEEIVYEGYGAGGVAILMDVVTDNKNRTLSELRHIFSKHNGNLGSSGCVAWMFEPKGLFIFDKKEVSEDALLEAALNAGADDVRTEEDTFEVLTAPEELERVKALLKDMDLKYSFAETTRLPSVTKKVAGKEAAQVLKLFELLEEHDDIQNVYANFDIDDEVMKSIESG